MKGLKVRKYYCPTDFSSPDLFKAPCVHIKAIKLINSSSETKLSRKTLFKVIPGLILQLFI